MASNLSKEPLLQRVSGSVKRFTNCFNGRLVYAITLIALSQVNFGFDQAIFTNTQAMEPFQREFGHWNPGNEAWVIEPYFLSLLNSLNYIGFAFGIVAGSYISARFGRRAVMFAMCGWAIAGAVLLVTAQHREQVLAGRVVAYVYIGMELAVVPVFQSELVPSRVRGFVVGSYQSGLLFGALLGSLVCRGTSTIDNNNAWRVPMGLLFIIPTIVGCGAFFMPESPRWLLLKGRDAEALRSLTSLRKGKFSDEQIRKELAEIGDSIDVTAEKGRWVELFQGPNLKRTLIVFEVNVFLQITGSNFSAVYGALFYRSLNTVNPYSINAGSSAINIFMVIVSQLSCDKVGRRPLMFVGTLMQTIGLLCVGGLGTIDEPSVGVRNGIVAAFVLFGAGFALGWAPLSHAIASEVPTMKLRDKASTYALGCISNIIIQWAVAFSVPYLLYEPYAALGSKVGFIFGAFAFVCLFFTWFCIPDCAGRTLEEIDRLFLVGTPLRDFKTAEVPEPAELVSESSLGKAHA